MERLTQSRPFLILLATMMLVALTPWHGFGDCCCCDGEEQAAALACCCGEEGAPEPPAPCPCMQMAEKAVGLPAVVGPEVSEQAVVVPHPAASVDTVRPSTIAPRLPQPRARTGPLLHLRLKVLLI